MVTCATCPVSAVMALNVTVCLVNVSVHLVKLERLVREVSLGECFVFKAQLT